jgi:hypothetical protein
MSYGGGYGGGRSGGSNGYSNGYDSRSGGYGAHDYNYDYNQYATYGYEHSIPAKQGISRVVIGAPIHLRFHSHQILRAGRVRRRLRWR